MMRRVLVAVLLASSSALGCERAQSGSVHEQSKLPPGVLARVGEQSISARAVASIASAQQVPLSAARERAVRDAKLALHARQRLHASSIASLERAILARQLLEQLRDQTRQGEPVSDEELVHLVNERWFELDRAAAARTSHAVVLVPSPDKDAAARRLAERIAAAVRDARTAAEFGDKARAVTEAGLDVRVEDLPFITVDGRAFRQSKLQAAAAEKTTFDLEYARAANALEGPGAISEPVKTEFGYHVIYLHERLPERRTTAAERRELLRDEVLSRRAAQRHSELLETLRGQHTVVVSRAADELTATVKF